MLKEIKVYRVMETTYEDGTCWIEYNVNNEVGYEITEDYSEGEENAIEGIYNSESFDKEKLINKPSINVCSKYLAKIIEECRQSDNEMWFVEYEDLEKELNTTEKDIIEKFLIDLQEEVVKLGLNNYITFGEDGCEITVYGGIITKFLF